MLKHLMRSILLPTGICWAGCSLPDSGDMAQTTGGEARWIALADICSTNNQEGLRKVSVYSNTPEIAPLAGINRHLGKNAASKQIFLVQTSTLGGAIRGTARVMVDGVPATAPVDVADRGSPPEYWVGVYFGSWTPDPMITIESVKIEGSRIRFVYRFNRPGAGHMMVHEFFAWAPIGQLTSGTYKLILIDSSNTMPEKAQEVVIQ